MCISGTQGPSGQISRRPDDASLDMYAALDARAAPPARPRISRIDGDRGARRAADARIALVIQGQARDLVGRCVSLDVIPGPVRERTDLGQDLARWQAE